jgi:hypothetical protein
MCPRLANGHINLPRSTFYLSLNQTWVNQQKIDSRVECGLQGERAHLMKVVEWFVGPCPKEGAPLSGEWGPS